MVTGEVRVSVGGCIFRNHGVLIDLILVPALSSLSLSLPARAFLVPTATRGFWLHNKGACGLFVRVCEHVSVAAPGLGKSNTHSFQGPVSLQAHVSALLIAALTVILLLCVCVCVCVRLAMT